MIIYFDYITFEYDQIYNIFSTLLSNYLPSTASIVNNYTPNNKIQNTFQSTTIPNISFMATSKVLSTIFQTPQGIVKYPFVTMQIHPQAVIDTGGQYDYATAQNADIQIQFFKDQLQMNKLFTQHVPIRIQNDNASLDVNIWAYSYQELNLIRDIIQRSFSLPRRMFYYVDLTKYIMPSLQAAAGNIDADLLNSLSIGYNIPLYFSLSSANDTTPTTVTTQVPLTKFTFTLNFDAWLPTDIGLDPLTTLINEIVIYFYTINNNNTETLDEIADITGDLSTEPPTIVINYDQIAYFNYLYNILSTTYTNINFVSKLYLPNILNLLSFTNTIVQGQYFNFNYNIRPTPNIIFTYGINAISYILFNAPVQQAPTTTFDAIDGSYS